MDDILNTLVSNLDYSLVPYAAAATLVSLGILWAAANEPPPGRTATWVYVLFWLIGMFGCGAIFNSLITTVLEPQKSGTFLLAIIGMILIGIATFFIKRITGR